MKKFVILQLAGFGDTLSAITRLPAVKKKYPEHEIVFYLGGFGKSVEFSKQQIEREGYKANIIKNLNFHVQLEEIRNLLKKTLNDGDILEDWSFCEDIFQNKEPVFYQYDMQFPYQYKTTKNTIDNTSNKIIAIHPLTKSGNVDGFESDVKNGRFWDRRYWYSLCAKLCNEGYIPAFVGHGDEDWGLIEELTNEGYKVLDKRMGVEETISFLQTVDGGIFCNSWDWEVTSRAGIPTFCFYTKNQFFIQNHVPKGPSDFWNNCYIEVRPEIYFRNNNDEKNNIESFGCVNSESVYEKFMYLVNVKDRPPFDYDVCMISYNDSPYIKNTLDNIEPYIKNKLCVVDGGSEDGTLDIIKSTIPSDKLSLKRVDWDNKFDVQKNNSIEMSEKEWILFIDADETYEHIFWNQIPWYISEAVKDNVDCLNVSRINTYTDITPEETFMKREEHGWNVNEFGWVNYPDFQQRLFTNNCRFEGAVHERIENSKCELYLYFINCVHKKTYEKQLKSFELYKNIER